VVLVKQRARRPTPLDASADTKPRTFDWQMLLDVFTPDARSRGHACGRFIDRAKGELGVSQF
jgi:hypothetical protein